MQDLIGDYVKTMKKNENSFPTIFISIFD